MNAIKKNTQKDVKNKKLSMLMLLPALLLAGCGKKIIECGDPAVESILKSTLSANLTKNPPEMDAMVSQISRSLNAPFQGVTALLKKGNFTETSSEPGILLGNIKLDAFSSTKKDKDSGMNYCTAMVSGDSIHQYKINVTDNFINGAGVLLPGMMDYFLTEEANAINETPTRDIKIKGIRTLEAKAGTNSLELKFVTSLPTNIAYTTNMTDKGDQIIVNLTDSGVQLTKATGAIDAVKVPIAFTYYIECLILILVGMLAALYGVKKFSLTIGLSFAIPTLAFLGMVGWLSVTQTVAVAIISVIIFFTVKPLSYFLIWFFGTVFVLLPFEIVYQHFTIELPKAIVYASMIAVLVAVIVFRKHVKLSLIGILSGWNVGLGLAGLVSPQLFASGHWLDALMLPGAMIFAGVVAGILFQYLYILKKRPEPVA